MMMPFFETGLHNHNRHAGASGERETGPKIQQVHELGLSKIRACRKCICALWSYT